jgi:riboflavin synthase
MFVVGPQTLSCTALGVLKVGDLVNMELPLQVGSRLGGHFVQGHVDGVGVIRTIVPDGHYRRVGIGVDRGLLEMLVPKGSVAVDGVSLTVAGLQDWGFWVALIPYTLKVNTLGRLEVGRLVNIEVDMIVKAVRQYLGQILNAQTGLTLDRLRAAGFC